MEEGVRMDAKEIVRWARKYGIRDMKDLDRKIREQTLLDISAFCRPVKEDKAS